MIFQGRRNIDCQSGMFGFPAVSHCRLLVILVFSFGRNKPNKLLFTHSGLMHGYLQDPLRLHGAYCLNVHTSSRIRSANMYRIFPRIFLRLRDCNHPTMQHLVL